MNIDVRTVGLESVEPYGLTTSTDLYTIEPPPMLIENVIPKGTITALTSAPGVGRRGSPLRCAGPTSSAAGSSAASKPSPAPSCS